MFEEIQARVAGTARRAGLKAAFGLTAIAAGATGVGFMADAAWRYLAVSYDTIIASTILGLAFLALALVLVVIAGAIGPRRPAPKPEPPRDESAAPEDDGTLTDAELIAMVIRAFRSGRSAGSRMRGR